jgi:hypothetical protein
MPSGAYSSRANYFSEEFLLKSMARLSLRTDFQQVDGDFFVRTRQWKGREARRGVSCGVIQAFCNA